MMYYKAISASNMLRVTPFLEKNILSCNIDVGFKLSNAITEKNVEFISIFQQYYVINYISKLYIFLSNVIVHEHIWISCNKWVYFGLVKDMWYQRFPITTSVASSIKNLGREAAAQRDGLNAKCLKGGKVISSNVRKEPFMSNTVLTGSYINCIAFIFKYLTLNCIYTFWLLVLVMHLII